MTGSHRKKQNSRIYWTPLPSDCFKWNIDVSCIDSRNSTTDTVLYCTGKLIGDVPMLVANNDVVRTAFKQQFMRRLII